MPASPREHWQNWSGRLTAAPAQLAFVRSEADAAALVRQAAADSLCVRPVGASHSHAPLVGNDGIIVDCSGLSGLIDANAEQQTARIWAGTPLYALGRSLHEVGLALHNQGDIDRQTVAGAVATGTHGSGANLGNLSSAVIGARLILASGDIVECDANNQPELFQACRLNLGALGLATQLTLQLRDSYRLQEERVVAPLDAMLEQLPELVADNRHFEFFWYPQRDQANGKRMNETAEPARYPVAAEGERCAQNYEVLPNYRPHPHTEMEYSVPAELGPQCMRAIATLLREDFTQVRWPVEYRTLAADNVWLSTAYERPTVTISVHQDISLDDGDYFRACEAIFLEHQGRPHWGKVHYLDGDQLAERYPQWQAWWSARDQADPRGRFLNDYLKALQPPIKAG